jgi:hypothetical protein
MIDTPAWLRKMWGTSGFPRPVSRSQQSQFAALVPRSVMRLAHFPASLAHFPLVLHGPTTSITRAISRAMVQVF